MGMLVAVEEKDDYAVIRLNRPEKKNAMNRAARRELLDAFTAQRDRNGHRAHGNRRQLLLRCRSERDWNGRQGRHAADPSSDWIEVTLCRYASIPRSSSRRSTGSLWAGAPR